MVAKLTNFLHGFVEPLVQGTNQLHLIRQASHAVMTFDRQHLSIVFFTGSTQEVLILGMLHLVILIVA
jgi:hypothetical protein